MSKYTLTYIRRDGQPFMTTVDGYLAESMIDAEFKRIKADPKVLFAVLIRDGDDEPRATHYASPGK